MAALPAAGTTAVAVLLGFFSAVLLARAADLTDGVIVLTVALVVSLARTQQGASPRRRLAGLALLPVVSVAASGLGRLLAERPAAGGALFTCCLAAAVWARRFGPAATAAGTLATLPLIALLITPVPLAPRGAGTPWAAVAGLLACLCVTLVHLPAEAIGLIPRRPAGAAHARRASPPARRSGPHGSRRIAPSTRMACQLAVALGAAFPVGRLAFPGHWTWTVLTAYLVCGANRGRGDALHRGALRVAGAAAGTAGATLLTGAFAPGDGRCVAVILAVLVLGAWLRTLSYACWAACVTAVLALLYGYYGEPGAELLGERLAATGAGAVLAVSACWFVLPVRSADVARRRSADALLALRELLAAAGENPGRLAAPGARWEEALGRCAELATPLRLHRRLRPHSGAAAAHPADVLDALAACATPVRALLRHSATHPAPADAPEFPGLLAALRTAAASARRAYASVRQAAEGSPA
ncbi:hypothetical protein D7294_25665 [Streptomyces hoynatensis]|uniref:Integral membrane bound transporter domain-containing protein n=1 Tax=Streptomyces hoynatensis TaxID=1141874 RepID=A0A3A9YR86_9ACTN|nr:hypothetical protein D7294_25665 [Streptomyces hoynatensis]